MIVKTITQVIFMFPEEYNLSEEFKNTNKGFIEKGYGTWGVMYEAVSREVNYKNPKFVEVKNEDTI